MKFKIKKCLRCKKYTLNDICRKCGAPTVTAHPAKFSPDDKYALYKARWSSSARRRSP
ncbi:MAG: RNA-protein complex protein Nop10 [Nitrososphaeria archaeon]|nr:RNA-protein complex protein Nop10 [Nitrososphaeria archaeon]